MTEHTDKFDAIKNYLFGGLGITIGLADVTSFFQAIGAIGGSILVLLQLHKQLFGKKTPRE